MANHRTTRAHDRFEEAGRQMIRFRYPVLLVIAAITIVSAFGLPKLTFDTSIENYFPKNSKIFSRQQIFERHFGNSDYVACLIRADDVFAPEMLKMIDSLGKDLKRRVPFADRVISLAEIPYSRVENGRIKTDSLVPEPVPEDPEKIEQIRRHALSRPYLVDRIVTEDATETWLVLQLSPYGEKWKKTHGVSPINAVGKAALEVLDQPEYRNYRIQPTGWPVMVYEELVFTRHESTRLMTIAVVIAVLFLMISLRSIRGVLIPFLVTGVALVNVFGVMGYMDRHVNAFLFSVPVVLMLAIAIGYSVHLFNYFDRRFNADGRRKASVAGAVGRAGWPMCFSALTTTGALLSFLAIELRPIQWLGVTSAVLIAVGYLLVMTLVPIVLSFGRDKPAQPPQQNAKFRSDALFKRLGNWIFRHTRAIMAVYILIMAICGYGLTQTYINIDTKNTYGDRVPYVNRMMEIADSDLGSFNSYNVTLDFKEKDAVKNPDILTALQAYLEKIEQLPQTKRATSMLFLVKEMNRLVHDGKSEYYRLPDNVFLSFRLFSNYAMQKHSHMAPWVADDFSNVRILVETRNLDARQTIREIETLRKIARKLFPDAGINITGGMPEYAALNQYVAEGQIHSLFIALGVIAVLMIFVFRSFKLGLTGMIPNITPLVVIGGVMGLTRTPIDFLTVTIAPMILGLSVDDTIHFIDYLKYAYRDTGSYRRATIEALRVVGRALLITSLVIVAAFSAYGFSRLNLMVNLGAFIMIGIASALLADYLVTPIVMRWSRVFREE